MNISFDEYLNSLTEINKKFTPSYIESVYGSKMCTTEGVTSLLQGVDLLTLSDYPLRYCTEEECAEILTMLNE